MARGEMVRYMAENQIKAIEEIKSFNRFNYTFCEKFSTKDTFVFVNKNSWEIALKELLLRYSYNADSGSVCLSYEVISDTVDYIRANKKIHKNWKNHIEEDFEKRSEKK